MCYVKSPKSCVFDVFPFSSGCVKTIFTGNEVAVSHVMWTWLRPRKSFVAAWIACGYFQEDHFPDDMSMSQAEAIETLDASGLLRSCGVPSDLAGAKPATKMHWSVLLEDSTSENPRYAYLPTVIATACDRLVCQHKRDRKLLVVRTPPDWMSKLKTVNARKMHITYNRRTFELATDQQISKGGKHLEKLTVTLEVADPNQPDGPGSYYISGANYPKKKLCYVSTVGGEEPSGLDLLKSAYDGGLA